MSLLLFWTDPMWPNSIHNVTAVIVANYYLWLLASWTYWNNICNSSIIDWRRHVRWHYTGISRQTPPLKAYSIKKLIDISKSHKERITEDLWKNWGKWELENLFALNDRGHAWFPRPTRRNVLHWIAATRDHPIPPYLILLWQMYNLLSPNWTNFMRSLSHVKLE